MPDQSDVMEPMVHQDQEPGHESRLEPKPDWQPRFKGSDRLKGKVALITGADSGIGRGVAALFAREGADVAILYLCEHDDAKTTKDKIPEFGKDTPMGRPGQPNEVAPCFLFLACEDSSYMTGQVLHPDGDCVQLSKWPEMAATGVACVRFRTQIATGSWRDTPFKGGKCC